MDVPAQDETKLRIGGPSNHQLELMRGYDRVDNPEPRSGVGALRWFFGLIVCCALWVAWKFGIGTLVFLFAVSIHMLWGLAVVWLPVAFLIAAVSVLNRRREQIRKLPSRPIFRRIDDSSIVELGDERKLAIAIESFDGNERWLEDFSQHIGFLVMAVQTTGGPHPHVQGVGEAQLYRFLLVDVAADEQKIRDYLSANGIRTKPLDNAIFASAASHDWDYAHYCERNVELGLPVQSIFSADFDMASHTVIVCVASADEFLLASVDLFLYSRAGVVPLVRPVKDRQQLMLHRSGKLKFAAAITSTPMYIFTRFKRIEPRKLILR